MKVPRTPAEVAAGYSVDDVRLADLPPTPAEIAAAEAVLVQAAEAKLRELEDRFVAAMKHLGHALGLLKDSGSDSISPEEAAAREFHEAHYPPPEAELKKPDPAVPQVLGGLPDPHPAPITEAEQLPITVQVPKP